MSEWLDQCILQLDSIWVMYECRLGLWHSVRTAAASSLALGIIASECGIVGRVLKCVCWKAILGGLDFLCECDLV